MENYASASSAFTEMYVLSPLLFLNSTTPSAVAKNCKVSSQAYIFTGVVNGASLANNNISGDCLLTSENFYA